MQAPRSKVSWADENADAGGNLLKMRMFNVNDPAARVSFPADDKNLVLGYENRLCIPASAQLKVVLGKSTLQDLAVRPGSTMLTKSQISAASLAVHAFQDQTEPIKTTFSRLSSHSESELTSFNAANLQGQHVGTAHSVAANDSSPSLSPAAPARAVLQELLQQQDHFSRLPVKSGEVLKSAEPVVVLHPHLSTDSSVTATPTTNTRASLPLASDLTNRAAEPAIEDTRATSIMRFDNLGLIAADTSLAALRRAQLHGAAIPRAIQGLRNAMMGFSPLVTLKVNPTAQMHASQKDRQGSVVLRSNLAHMVPIGVQPRAGLIPVAEVQVNSPQTSEASYASTLRQAVEKAALQAIHAALRVQSGNALAMLPLVKEVTPVEQEVARATLEEELKTSVEIDRPITTQMMMGSISRPAQTQFDLSFPVETAASGGKMSFPATQVQVRGKGALETVILKAAETIESSTAVPQPVQALPQVKSKKRSAFLVERDPNEASGGKPAKARRGGPLATSSVDGAAGASTSRPISVQKLRPLKEKAVSNKSETPAVDTVREESTLLTIAAVTTVHKLTVPAQQVVDMPPAVMQTGPAMNVVHSYESTRLPDHHMENAADAVQCTPGCAERGKDDTMSVVFNDDFPAPLTAGILALNVTPALSNSAPEPIAASVMQAEVEVTMTDAMAQAALPTEDATQTTPSLWRSGAKHVSLTDCMALASGPRTIGKSLHDRDQGAQAAVPSVEDSAAVHSVRDTLRGSSAPVSSSEAVNGAGSAILSLPVLSAPATPVGERGTNELLTEAPQPRVATRDRVDDSAGAEPLKGSASLPAAPAAFLPSQGPSSEFPGHQGIGSAWPLAGGGYTSTMHAGFPSGMQTFYPPLGFGLSMYPGYPFGYMNNMSSHPFHMIPGLHPFGQIPGMGMHNTGMGPGARADLPAPVAAPQPTASEVHVHHHYHGRRQPSDGSMGGGQRVYEQFFAGDREQEKRENAQPHGRLQPSVSQHQASVQIDQPQAHARVPAPTRLHVPHAPGRSAHEERPQVEVALAYNEPIVEDDEQIVKEDVLDVEEFHATPSASWLSLEQPSDDHAMDMGSQEPLISANQLEEDAAIHRDYHASPPELDYDMGEEQPGSAVDGVETEHMSSDHKRFEGVKCVVASAGIVMDGPSARTTWLDGIPDDVSDVTGASERALESAQLVDVHGPLDQDNLSFAPFAFHLRDVRDGEDNPGASRPPSMRPATADDMKGPRSRLQGMWDREAQCTSSFVVIHPIVGGDTVERGKHVPLLARLRVPSAPGSSPAQPVAIN